MSRLLVICEGQTEEDFVKEILREHLGRHGWSSVAARLMGNARQRSHRGGIRGWPDARKDIVRHLKQDHDCYITTLVDYYALPDEGQSAWPGKRESSNLPFEERGSHIENAIAADLEQHLGRDARMARRFVPFILVHEFEALCFADPQAFCNSLQQPQLAQQMQAIRSDFSSPEEINENPNTAPSKRILNLFPTYVKPLYGILGLLNVGLDTIRAECEHFDEWITKLENLSVPS